MKRITIGAHVVQWVSERTGEWGNYGAAQGIGLQEFTGDHWLLIAGVVYNEFNGVNINMHVASDGSRRWMNRKYLWTCFDYPFNQCKVKRITGLVGEGNIEARKFDEHLGFELETQLKDAHPTGAMLVYVMRKPQCRWLTIKVPHEDLHEKRLALAA